MKFALCVLIAAIALIAVVAAEEETFARVQAHAPEVRGQAVHEKQFMDFNLNDYLGKYVVLFFYPLDFTFVCPTEIIEFSNRFSEFEAIDTAVVAVSTDSVFSHLAWVKTSRDNGGLGDIAFPLVSDTSHQISRRYGVLIEDEGIALRGLFIISDTGVVRHITINDLPVGRNVDEVLRLVKAFKHTDVVGEVCPAGWKDGERTMKADPEGSQEYFKATWGSADEL